MLPNYHSSTQTLVLFKKKKTKTTGKCEFRCLLLLLNQESFSTSFCICTVTKVILWVEMFVTVAGSSTLNQHGAAMQLYIGYNIKVTFVFCLPCSAVSFQRRCAGVGYSCSTLLSGGNFRKNSGGDQRQWDWRGPAVSSDVQLHDLPSDVEEASQAVCWVYA